MSHSRPTAAHAPPAPLAPASPVAHFETAARLGASASADESQPKRDTAARVRAAHDHANALSFVATASLRGFVDIAARVLRIDESRITAEYARRTGTAFATCESTMRFVAKGGGLVGLSIAEEIVACVDGIVRERAEA